MKPGDPVVAVLEKHRVIYSAEGTLLQEYPRDYKVRYLDGTVQRVSKDFVFRDKEKLELMQRFVKLLRLRQLAAA